MFSSTNFRKRPKDINAEVFDAKTNPMVIFSESGDCGFYQTRDDKLIRLSNVDWAADLVTFVRGGKRKSDVFRMTKEDYDAFVGKPVDDGLEMMAYGAM